MESDDQFKEDTNNLKDYLERISVKDNVAFKKKKFQ